MCDEYEELINQVKRPELVKQIIENGVYNNCQDVLGNTPLMAAIRKLEWLSKAKFVKKNPESKRYHLLQNNLSDSLLNHPLTNIKATTGRFSKLSSIVYRSMIG